MAYYLIDYENVRISGMNGFSNLTEDDKVIIFYSDNSDSLTFGLHYQLMTSSCQVEYHKVETGTKNALDFQLSSYLGYVIRENKSKSDSRFFIVSKDNGFSVLCTYWQNKDISVEIIMNLNGEKNPEPSEITESVMATPEEITEILSEIIWDNTDIDFVISSVMESHTRNEISNKLNSYFRDGTKVHEIFTSLKPFIKNLPGR
ncbi:MAG: hypothetical protein K2J39_03855 [Ruminococcus sp.]|nr:hypothetical protein [Ruminococcus sp.]